MNEFKLMHMMSISEKVSMGSVSLSDDSVTESERIVVIETDKELEMIRSMDVSAQEKFDLIKKIIKENTALQPSTKKKEVSSASTPSVSLDSSSNSEGK